MSTDTSIAPWLTIRDLCARLKLSRATVYQLIARGTLPAPVHFGRCARWREADVHEAEQRLIAAATRGGGES